MRRLTWLGWIVAGACIGVAAAPREPAEITAKRINLTDRHGKIRAIFGTDTVGGHPEIALYDDDGRFQGRITLEDLTRAR